MASEAPNHTVLDSSFPVLLPRSDALFMSETDFQAWVKKEISNDTQTDLVELKEEISIIDSAESKTLSSSSLVSTKTRKRPASDEADNNRVQKAPFLAGLEKHQAHHRTKEDLIISNKTLTQKGDVTNISSQNPLVDLFYDLSENTPSDKLKLLLESAWKDDAVLTLKIIFNARSIHLGKSNRVASYKAFGWLADNHPLTLLVNLPWLVRPIIAKKASKPNGEEVKGKGDEDDFEMIDIDEADLTKSQNVQYGLSHGYWKDLLNLAVFAANDQLKFDGDPASLLNQQTDKSKGAKKKRDWNQESAKATRLQRKVEQNQRVQEKLKEDSFYRALHYTVARLFAEQLKQDKMLLDSGKRSDLRKLSLAAKWAPSFGEFHDKHTFILSSIAEILFPNPALSCPDATNRELYLRHVREHYRKQYASPLRKALSVVERDITANTFNNIKYETVPSLAMNRYTKLFMEKDFERFQTYIQDVAKGNAKISGATLMPSTLIAKVRTMHNVQQSTSSAPSFKAVRAAAESQIQAEVIDGQWKALVQRVRDAGTLQSSLAVCDVSGSMSFPRFKDLSCPMDSAIGLSLLIAEVTAPPFGGGFISFSEQPTYISLKSDAGLVEQVGYITQTPWGMTTDFVAVFEDVILPMAVANNLTQEDMVKQVFVFSDMQFDAAQPQEGDSWNASYDATQAWVTKRWTTSYQRIEEKYAAAGYQVPRLVFWNLASSSTDKPTTMADADTVLVSGYSQGMLRAFLESGALGEGDEEVVEEEIVGEDGLVEVKSKKKKKADSLSVVKKTLAAKAYEVLEVVD
jgi:hypothetical protein